MDYVVLNIVQFCSKMFTEASSVSGPVWRSGCTDTTVRACDVISRHRDVTLRDNVAWGRWALGTEKGPTAKGLSSTTVTERHTCLGGLTDPSESFHQRMSWSQP